MQFIPWRIVINSPPFSTESTVFSDRLLPVVKWPGNIESISRCSTVKIAPCFDPVSISVYSQEFYLLRTELMQRRISFFRYSSGQIFLRFSLNNNTAESKMNKRYFVFVAMYNLKNFTRIVKNASFIFAPLRSLRI